MTKENFEMYKAIIERYQGKNPEEWKTFEVQLAMTRQTLKNSFGANEAETMRFVGQMPERLDKMLRVYNPDYLTENNFEFLKVFKMFKVAKKL